MSERTQGGCGRVAARSRCPAWSAFGGPWGGSGPRLRDSGGGFAARERTAGHCVNASPKFPENQRFEIVGFLALLGRILWFDPRREHSSIPTANSRSRRAQGLSRLAASSRPPAGLGLDWPEHGGILTGSGLEALTTS